MPNNQNDSNRIYLKGKKDWIYERVKSKNFVYEDNDGLVLIAHPSFITRKIDNQVYDKYEEYKMLDLDTEKNNLEKVKEIFGIFVDVAKRKAPLDKNNREENDVILKQYINNLTDEEIASYVEQIQKHNEIARLTSYFL